MKTNTERLFIAIIFLLVFGMSIRAPVDADMWWHLRSGQEMWNSGSILLEDQFSFTKAGDEWVNAFWITDIGTYGLWRLGGFFAIALAVSTLGLVICLIIFQHMDGSTYLRGAMILLVAMGVSANWTARPQLISFVIIAALDLFLYIHMTRKRQPLWILPILFALWGNFHGGFIWGALLIIAVIIGSVFDLLLKNDPKLSAREVSTLGGWSVAALAAVVINPNGWKMWELPFKQVDVSLQIQEWLSPDFHQFYPHPVLWMLFLLILGLALGEKRISFADLFKTLGFAYLFFFAQRNLVVFVIVSAPIVFRALNTALNKFSQRTASQAPENPSISNQIINIGLTSFLTTGIILYTYIVSMPASIAKETPEESVAWIKENRPQGRIFNSYNWGGYLTWALQDYPVFIDGRADLYGDEMIQDWMDISNGTERGLELLDEYEIKLIYLEPHHTLLDKLPPELWKKVYADKKIVIYQKLR